MSTQTGRRHAAIPKPSENDILIFGSKRCDGCDLKLPRNSEQFGHDHSEPDGFNTTCRSCRSKQNQTCYAKRRGRSS